ncbi:MAG: RNA ligase [Candidatus Methanoperedens sp.]|nr:RNA ligase [Candidatus Methanoperedens sp.]MCZ7370237.1 RNA ligase [Candidatus Methanoperedens sp.]
MRRDVSSELINKLDIAKISKLTGIPEYRITGAIQRKTLQYIKSKLELFRFDKPISTVEGGTSIFLEPFDIIRGFPKISRTLMLYPGIARHFSSCKKVFVEEKMNGYNVRVATIGDHIVGLTRGGFVCPYTTEKARELLNREFFLDNPGLVLCGEMVGPDSPYVPKSFYDIESLEFFAFDIRDKISGNPMPVLKRRKLLEEYGVQSVRLFGEYDVENAHIDIAKIIKEFGNSLHEGVVIKDPEMALPAVKYTSSLSNCADLKYAFEFYNDYGRDFFFARVCREAFQSLEWDEDEQRRQERCLRLGESILLPMIKTIKNKKEGERIYETVQIRVKNLDIAREFEDHLRLLGVDAVFEKPEKIGDEYLIKIRKMYPSTNDKTESILSGQLWS